jgi:hypothetical protein
VRRQKWGAGKWGSSPAAEQGDGQEIADAARVAELQWYQGFTQDRRLVTISGFNNENVFKQTTS